MEDAVSVGFKKEGAMRPFIKRHERLLSFIAFVTGFIFDGLTLRYVNLYEAAVLLGAYLVAIAVCIVLYNALSVREFKRTWVPKLASWIPFVIQFLFGTLLNSSFLFFASSAELSISWPFLVFIAGVVLVNEVWRKRHQQLTFQTSIFFVATFMYFAFVLPLLLERIGDDIFLLSGVLSLLAVSILALLLYRFARRRYFEKILTRVATILLLYALITGAYFWSIIPPIPLAIKDIGLFHSVERVGVGYRLTAEEDRSYYFWQLPNRTFHAMPGEDAFVFTAIFAPGKLSVPVYHEWYRFDEMQKRWVLMSRVQFPIRGGRDSGYRGYSQKSNIEEGKWRVDITTGHYQHLGSIKFEVRRVQWPPTVKTVSK